jgi:hypothetical protein
MFSDPVLLGGIAVGLVMGSFGYVLVRFGWRPVGRYRRLKKRIGALVGHGCQGKLDRAARDRLRQMAVELQALMSDELPHWFQLAIKRRGEMPQEAIAHIQSLVNCRDKQALVKRCQAVRQALGLATDEKHRHGTGSATG